MIPALRPYQQTNSAEIDIAWMTGYRVVMYVLPTGGGKTVTFSEKLAAHRGAAVSIAHRQELVGQISMSLSRFAVRHRIIGPRNVIKSLIDQQNAEFGRSFYDPNSPIGVAGVDTLIRRGDALKQWCDQITLFVGDEGHHYLRSNKWGKAVALFPHARGLLVTATPERADGKGLGRHAEGIADTMVCGPSMRELIRMGYLSDYRIFAPPSDIDLTTVKIASDGDYNRDDLREASRRSHIVGDVVAHYLKIAPGLLGVTFATDVETAGKITDQFVAAGVRAALVTAETPDDQRRTIINQFRRGIITQLVNVDLFGEGFDVPGIMVVSMARPTQSFSLYAQQFGRALRVLDGKTQGIIIDHVHNVENHGLPDRVRSWSLDSRERGSRGKRDADFIPVTTCTSCFRSYEATTSRCPFCGLKPAGVPRSTPVQVQGDLTELDPATLAEMRGEILRIDGPAQIPVGIGGPAGVAIARNWKERQDAQSALRSHIALWAGWRKAEGMDDSEIYRRFFFRYGIDIMSAQALNKADASALTAKIEDDLP